MNSIQFNKHLVEDHIVQGVVLSTGSVPMKKGQLRPIMSF